MGRGEGGGKSGGGGRKARTRGAGGGSAYNNQHLEPTPSAINASEHATLADYADLPNIENDNRKILSDGQVVVGAKGAPAAPKAMSHNDAYDTLKATGVPQNYLSKIANLGDEALSDVAGLVKGWKWEGGGAEGAVWSKGGKVRRIQTDGAVPLNHYNIGKIGAYSEWKKRYGTGSQPVWVEQKPRIWKTVGKTGMDVSWDEWSTATKADRIRVNMMKNTQKVDPRITNFNDLHRGNWGFDSKGRARIIDPGAAIPPGAKILANW